MGFYDKVVLPKLLHFACGLGVVNDQRQKVVPDAAGIILEIGIGSGLNLPFYQPEKVERVFGLDPSDEMRTLARREAALQEFKVEFMAATAEAIPLPDECVDTVLVTYTLCTIPNIEAALFEMRRVLKSGGTLIFCEHGLSQDPAVRRWQHRMDGLWGRFTGGCHLNRDIPALIQNAGFQMQHLDHGYISGWKPACFNYMGRAV